MILIYFVHGISTILNNRKVQNGIYLRNVRHLMCYFMSFVIHFHHVGPLI